MDQLNKFCLLFTFFYIPQILANNAIPDINEIRNSIKMHLPLQEIDMTNNEEMTKTFADVVKQKCFEVSKSDAAYDNVLNASTTFSECIQNTVDFSNIGDEIEQAKPTGELDAVFGKYCNKMNKVSNCLEAFSNAINPCFTDDEISHKTTIIGMIKRLLEFVCLRNGNQIALFIAEQGPECIISKKSELTTCFNQTYGKLALDDAKFTISQENCVDVKKFEVCVVGELEKCQEKTTANLVEALFRYVKKETICREQKSSASSLPFLSLIMLITSMFLSFYNN